MKSKSKESEVHRGKRGSEGTETTKVESTSSNLLALRVKAAPGSISKAKD